MKLTKEDCLRALENIDNVDSYKAYTETLGIIEQLIDEHFETEDYGGYCPHCCQKLDWELRGKQMNYMKEVAQMLGLELEEEFYIKGNDNKFKITNRGMCYSFRSTDMWAPVSWVLCDILNGKLEIVKKPKPILDEVEKRYLSNVIKPFRNKVSYIYKQKNHCSKMEWIGIGIENDLSLEFPSFEIGTMYKGMELGKQYSLEDLEL